MRRIITTLLCLTVAPAQAWTVGAQGRVCTLDHSMPGAGIMLTYDSAGPFYTLTITRDAGWSEAPVFAMRFEGGLPLTISTTRHTLGADGRSLSVADTGFGNVLDGLANNDLATAFAGPAAVAIPLDGAAPAVAAFRDCAIAPAV